MIHAAQITKVRINSLVARWARGSASMMRVGAVSALPMLSVGLRVGLPLLLLCGG